MIQEETQEKDLLRRRHEVWGIKRQLGSVVLVMAVVLTVTACGVSDGGLPPDVKDPSTFKNPSGALARYRSALATLRGAFEGAMFTGGLLTDELAAVPVQLGVIATYTQLDSRQNPVYSPARLQKLRAQAREARGFLVTYAPDSSPALQSHLYAVEGYAEIYLADLFCSGIPLSTVDFDENYTLAPGSSTADVYRHAITLFDSAIALASDSVNMQHLAALGRGRALLALGQYAAAAEAVAVVPDGYRYQTVFSFNIVSAASAPDSAALWWFQGRSEQGAPSVANQEGEIGLNYRASGDSRTVTSPSGNIQFPSKYAMSSPITFTVASGIEARLIEAEAALQSDDDNGRWLEIINYLRQTEAVWSTIVPQVFTPLDMLDDPGTDGPGIDPSRVDLLFRERAFWLYLTAHRQGDLRRLIRQYPGRSPVTVYPKGAYPGGGGVYGSEVVIPMPESERVLNPLYTGCVHRNA